MPSIIFMTGTDTGIGKTLTTCALSHLMFQQGRQVKYLKPFQTGPKNTWDGLTVQHLGKINLYDHPYFWTHEHPGAPFESLCFFDAKPFEPSALLSWLKKETDLDTHDVVLVEGCGGILVPFTRELTLIDVLRSFPKAKTILVSSLKLGTLNHTRLSLNVLQELPNPCGGVVFFGEGNLRNIEMLETLYPNSVLGHVVMNNDTPLFKTLNEEKLSCLLG